MASEQGEERPLADRMMDVEVRLAYLENMLIELDKVVIQATDELAQVRKVVGAMQNDRSEDNAGSRITSLEEEVPPHY